MRGEKERQEGGKEEERKESERRTKERGKQGNMERLNDLTWIAILYVLYIVTKNARPDYMVERTTFVVEACAYSTSFLSALILISCLPCNVQNAEYRIH